MPLTRRTLLRTAFLCAAVARTGHAEELEPLREDEATARAYDYRSDGTRVDAAAFPEFDASQACSNCTHFKENHGCALFPRRSVSPRGWCKVWQPQE